MSMAFIKLPTLLLAAGLVGSAIAQSPNTNSSVPVATLATAEPITIDLAKRTWQGIPGLERTEKGRVYSCWFTGGPKEPSPDNTVLLSYSDDAGKTFTPPEAIALPTSDGTRTFDPTLWIDPKGRLWYIFNRGNKDIPRHDVWARVCDDPDATPPVFGAEFRVGYGVPYAFRMNKPTVLSSGEWIMPVTHAGEEVIHDWFAGPKQLQGVGISTDEGKTWKLHGALKAPEWALECMVTELKDGRLWMLIRTGKGALWESHSSDKGVTWSEAKASTIKNPGSRFFIRRLASGNLLLVNHYKYTGRSHLTARISTDDGATWNEGLLLDERGGGAFANGVPGGVSYPDGVQDKDGLIWITYDRGRNGDGEILLAKFREEDATAGKDVSGAVSLKQVISKLDKDGARLNALSPDEAGRGFVSLFDGASFGGWEQKGNWAIEDGAFARVRSGGPLTYVAKTVPDDFEARFEWKVSKGCNSGVYYRPGQVEYQILDNAGSPYGENPRQSAASLFFCMAPSKDASRPLDEWQEARIVCKGSVIQHWLNGVKVVDFDYTDPKWKEEIELLRIRGGDLSKRGGKLWLQDHGAPVWFRKLRWREIPATEAVVPDPTFQPMPIPAAALEKEKARVSAMQEKATSKLLPADWDPKPAGDKVLTSMLKVSAPQVKGAHDADLVLLGEHAYIVEHDNDIKPGHGAGNAQYCVLTVVNVKTMSVERVVPMAKSAEVFANETLPAGACFVPRIIQLNDTTLRCFFVCEDQSGKRQSQTWYRDFDMASLTFAPDIHRVKMKTGDGIFDMQPQYFYADAAKQGFKQPAKAFGLYLLDSFKLIDGKTYLAINNFPGAQNALATLNESRDTIEVLGHYNEPTDRRLTESSVNRLPDGTWTAICRTESGDRNYVFTTSKDGKTWTPGEPRDFVVKGSNSKPTFDRFHGVYYLGWQEATRIVDGHGVGRAIFNIDVSRDGVHWERKYRFESADGFQYPTFRLHDGAIWFSVTQGTGGSTDRIMFGKLESGLK
jgi:predicted neuraminidase